MPSKEHVAKIVVAYAKGNRLAADQLPGLIETIHAALSSVGTEPDEQPTEFLPAVPIRRSIKPNSITCLDCGHEAKMLSRHLMASHGLTPQTYRQRWGLNSEYPVVAPAYAERRRELAISLGLGKRGRGAKF